MEDNFGLLAELAERRAWVHVMKRRPLWCYKVGEGAEDAVGQAGQWVCRGLRGELWASDEAQLRAHYRPAPAPQRDGRWVKWLPRADVPGFWAARAPRPALLHTPFGAQALRQGDWVLRYRPAAGRGDDALFPSDLWAVPARDFPLLYSRAADPQQIANAVHFMQCRGLTLL